MSGLQQMKPEPCCALGLCGNSVRKAPVMLEHAVVSETLINLEVPMGHSMGEGRLQKKSWNQAPLLLGPRSWMKCVEVCLESGCWFSLG